ncbi:hypothetical protein NP493_654g00004 [Ridgeia piscesae]|uniref:lysozyme n=1 Tax=Ridgeia piscesae TaxID=27915 RepID=A0AAD9NQ20_RIDPI|nr:hypothetical protein NP493_654g00004 [Ridgeia piscesae]
MLLVAHSTRRGTTFAEIGCSPYVYKYETNIEHFCTTRPSTSESKEERKIDNRDPCAAVGGACVDICSGGVCSSGGLFTGLCTSPERCCIPQDLVVGDNCLNCICQSASGGCIDVKSGNGLGYFRITWPYWSDCGKPGGSYNACVHNYQCSRQCVVAYLKRYVTSSQTCERFSRIHKGGPWGWKWGTDAFWSKVNACCGKLGGC